LHQVFFNVTCQKLLFNRPMFHGAIEKMKDAHFNGLWYRV